MIHSPRAIARAAIYAALALAAPLQAAITITGVADKTKYNNTVSFTVTADPNAATTTANVDGFPITVGLSATVTAISYHELKAESRTAGGALVDSKLIRFIVRDNAIRGDTEDGIPPHTPFRTVNDAPSAFAAGQLRVIAPAAWPVGLPVPIAATLRDPAGEPLRLNGIVSFSGLPKASLQLRRGWGSTIAPAVTTAGDVALGAFVNGAAQNRSIRFEAAPTFTDVSGTIAASTVWPANAHMRVTGTLTINAGATLTIGEGTVVLVSTGSATNGSAAEIVVNGTLQINGVDGNPVVFAPATAGENWGGIELPVATSIVNATQAIFAGSGEDETWFSTHSGYSSHKPQQALFLVAGSGAGTAIGAQLHLTDCYCFSLAGQEMNSKTNTWIDLQRTLMQRAVTCGEMNGSKVSVDRSALMEFPREDATFVDGDNDAIYLTNGDLSITRTVIGFTKDDGVDSGGNGGNSPFGTVDPLTGNTVTRFVSSGNWYEGTYHEGNSLSGTRNVTFTGCVFLNCGQGVEAGYSTSATGDGPNALVDGCLFVSNMVGARWGDNYGSGYNYNASMEVKNSILLNSLFHDVWSYHWLTTVANGWTYLDATTSNSFGHPYLNVHDNRLSQPDPLHHPANALWNPAVDGSSLAPFMPVPNSNVGVAISTYAPAQSDPTTYPGLFTVRLSTFSSRPVSVDWAVLGKADPFTPDSAQLASGTLTFAPGETLKTITAQFPSAANYAVLHVHLSNPVNAEVTGEAWYFRPSSQLDGTLVATASTGWRYRETRSEPPANWKQLGFDDSSAAATEWLPCTMPAGFGVSGITLGTPVNGGSSTDRTKAFYFRKKFTVGDAAAVNGLTLRIRRDDAAVVWLNNEATPTIVSADGTFNAPYSYDATTLAANNVPNSTNTGTYLSYTIPPSKLVTGTNILAIQLHQTSLTSSDILLDCELTAAVPPPLELKLTRSGVDPVLWWFDSNALLESSSDLGSWTPVPGATSPLPFTPGGLRGFFRLRR